MVRDLRTQVAGAPRGPLRKATIASGSKERAPQGAPRRTTHVRATLAGWGSRPVVRELLFSLGWQATRVAPYVRYPLPSKESRHMPERDDLGPPAVPGGPEIGLGSRSLRPRRRHWCNAVWAIYCQRSNDGNILTKRQTKHPSAIYCHWQYIVTDNVLPVV